MLCYTAVSFFAIFSPLNSRKEAIDVATSVCASRFVYVTLDSSNRTANPAAYTASCKKALHNVFSR